MERELSAASITEPKMLAPPYLTPVTVETGVKVGRKSFGKEQLAFVKGTERSSACGVGAFMEHGLGPVFSSVNFGQREVHATARERPKSWQIYKKFLTCSRSELQRKHVAPDLPALSCADEEQALDE
jgi:hypothetical protein